MIDTGNSGPGINGGLSPREKPGEGTTNVIDVASVDDAVRKVQSSGGKVTSAKHAVPGVGWLAYCTDTEGNEFGMLQADEEAK
jgi:predicted enzyme related to lactoylglutathione lyase